jgi:hypothetical protein
MARCLWFVVAVGLLTGSEPASAQQGYTVRPAKARQGACVLVEKKQTDSKHMLVQDRAGKILANKEQGFTDTIVYRESLLAKAEGQEQATHLQKAFDQARRQVGDRAIVLPFEGKTYDIEFRDGRYQFRYLSGEPMPAEAIAALDREYNSHLGGDFDFEKLVFPSTAARPGDTWSLDLGRVVNMMRDVAGMQIDRAGATATARLSQVYERNKHLFAVVDAVLDLPATSIARGKTAQPLQPGSGCRIRLQLNCCIDGGAEVFVVDVNMENKTILLAPGPNRSTVSVQQTSALHIIESRRELVQQ